MTVLFVLLGLLLVLIVYLLLAPVIVWIDTLSNEYYVRIPGVVKMAVESHEKELIRLQLRVFFLNFYFYPLKWKKKKKKKDEIKEFKPKKDKKKKKKRMSLGKMVRLMRTFRVQRFYLNIDTGDYALNAKLYPVFYLLNQTKGHFAVNFEDRNQLSLVIVNRPIRIVKSFINL